ncbi:hypothetical protein Bcell_2633 [Evansella cellulosilytica DSM 2522]|uniref:Uncharacterized protein n=2 Tax=Evansella TaxID=2837485 RepID=E6TUK0_EVAC2|nr:hypothetical protein Bcell_2633 [Evansella cellulosilytica DSM 2522]
MSFSEVNTVEIVKTQFKYKVSSYINVYGTLIGVQIFALALSFLGGSSFMSSNQAVALGATTYTDSLIVGFSVFWAFITSILLTTKQMRSYDYTFVSNRLTSHISNIVFLIIMSVIGAISAKLVGLLMKVIIMLTYSDPVYGALTSFPELLVGMAVAAFYLILFAALGYAIGLVAQMNKIFIFLIPSLFIASLLFDSGENGIITNILKFFIGETSLSVFFIKVLVTITLLFLLSFQALKRLEVRG